MTSRQQISIPMLDVNSTAEFEVDFAVSRQNFKLFMSNSIA